MSLPEVKKINFNFQTQSVACKGACAFFFVVDEAAAKNKKLASAFFKDLEKRFKLPLGEIIESGDFEGKWLQTFSTLCPQKDVAKRLALMGAGSKTVEAPARARHLGLKIADELGKLKSKNVFVALDGKLFENDELLLQFVYGIQNGSYKYPSISGGKDKKDDTVNVTIICSSKTIGKRKTEWESISKAIQTCRLLQDGPPNIVTPKFIADTMSQQAKKAGIKTTVYNAQKLKEMGMNAILAVGGGSCNEPHLLVFEYKPKKFKSTIAFVGKGLTFDTGGYSIKAPSNFQVGMKYDMSGSAVCLSSLIAIAELELPVHVYAVTPLAENMIDAHAYRVDDVIKTYSGKTIEVLNTDAEGRIVLSDALFYTANTLKPDYIFEYSTLTGAMVVSLGHLAAGVFPFNSDKIAGYVQDAAKNTGERIWVLPTFEELNDDLKSDVADIANITGPSSGAGSISAAMFLKEFVEKVPYAHIDIAGVANSAGAIGYNKKGGSGFGVQLSVELAKNFAK